MRTIIVLLAFIVPIIPLKAQWVQQNIPSNSGLILSIDFANSLNGCTGGWVGDPIGTNVIGRSFYKSSSNVWSQGLLPDSTRAIVNLKYTDGVFYGSGAYNITSDENKSVSLPIFLPEYLKERFYRLGMSDVRGSNYGAYFIKSTNNGVSWFPFGEVLSGFEYVISMDFATANTGYLCAERSYLKGTILKTTNGGSNWVEQPLPDSVYINEIEFIDNETGFAAGFRVVDFVLQAVVYNTTNGGITWQEKLFPDVNNFSGVSFISQSTGFLIGIGQFSFSTLILKTTNGGINWTQINTIQNLLPEGIEFLSSGYGIYYGENGSSSIKNILIGSTSNNGLTWQLDSIDYTDLITGAKMLDPSNWYVAGGFPWGDAVVFHTTTGGSVFIEPIGSEVPSSYSLEQNYPNPFNPSTRIRFSIPVSSETSLKVYDIMGREVAKLVDQKLSAGNYEVEFSGENLNTGIYFYRFVSAGKNFVKKMILVK